MLSGFLIGLVVTAFAVALLFLGFYFRKSFIRRNILRREFTLMDKLRLLEHAGLTYHGDYYSGIYKGYFVTIRYAGSQNKVEIVVPVTGITEMITGSSELRKSFTLFTKAGVSYTSFIYNASGQLEPVSGVKAKLDHMIDLLKKNKIPAYNLN